MPATLPLDLHYHIIDLVLSHCLGWSLRDALTLRGLAPSSRAKAREARAFLARCCLVSKYWLVHAQMRLYMVTRLTPFNKARIEAYPCLARHTKHLNVDARDGRVATYQGGEMSAAELFLFTRVQFPYLKSLIVWDNSYLGIRLPKVPEWSIASSSLTHLLSMGSSAAHLAFLMAALPNLTSLHIGRLSFARQGNGHGIDFPPATCKLRGIVFQTLYHFDGQFLDCILGSSKESIERITLANCGTTFYDILDYITGATSLTLSVKEGDYTGRVQEDDTLDRLLGKFSDLKRVQVYVRKSWTGDWPDHGHAVLARKFNAVDFSFYKADDDFLRGYSPMDTVT